MLLHRLLDHVVSTPHEGVVHLLLCDRVDAGGDACVPTLFQILYQR